MMCNKQLSTGEELYIIDENKFVCKEDYLNNASVKDTNLLSGMRSRIALYFFDCMFIKSGNYIFKATTTNGTVLVILH